MAGSSAVGDVRCEVYSLRFEFCAADASEAEVTGGLSTIVVEGYAWDAITSPDARPGSAAFTI